MELERQMARVIINISSLGDQYDPGEDWVEDVRTFSGAAGYAESVTTGSVTQITPYARWPRR